MVQFATLLTLSFGSLALAQSQGWGGWRNSNGGTPPPWVQSAWSSAIQASATGSPVSRTTIRQPSPPPAIAQPSPPPAITQPQVCTVEIFSYTTQQPGLRTRTRTRTIIMNVVSTITSLITTTTESVAVETVIQENRERTVTTSTTVCGPQQW
ncbi:hypothetical protein EJ06DRAFT_524692 [Trichodelitschia bisporula]|uniref:Uncharacterized protein n=1 Tax=Trichodelitschia bisporula TaxID=703511 RepID=A0A6G1HKA4_9PEZI|nr:hypothetical protein EJ06DRAFT_524692 [Trichodelitschia bisporula]